MISGRERPLSVVMMPDTYRMVARDQKEAGMLTQHIDYRVRGLYNLASSTLKEAGMSAAARPKREALIFREKSGLEATLEHAGISRSGRYAGRKASRPRGLGGRHNRRRRNGCGHAQTHPCPAPALSPPQAPAESNPDFPERGGIKQNIAGNIRSVYHVIVCDVPLSQGNRNKQYD